MNTYEFNNKFGEIVGDDQSIQFMIGNKDGEQFLIIFYGDVPEREWEFDELDILFERHGNDMRQHCEDAIMWLMENY